MKWRIRILVALVVFLTAIFAVGFYQNARLKLELRATSGLPESDGLFGNMPIEPARKIAPVTETSVVSEETVEVEVDRSELDAKLKALGYHSSDTLHRVSLSTSVESESSLTNN